MKLIKAHIQNFGKLSNCDFDFNEGLNALIHENGWGKTTLSVFIKSMFYGMEYTTSKDLEKNEKLKYLPWQGGIYGGSLVFSHNDKIYQIHRTFDLKKNEDTFELRDLKTNKISYDFSENLGNELFGINRETYARSVYVVLDEKPAASDDISAKLGNLIEAADVSNFDDAMAFLDKKATSLKAKRGNSGEISQIQENIDSDRNNLTVIETKILQNENYEKKIAEVKANIEELKNVQEELTKQLAVSAKYEGKLRYEQLKADLEAAENSKKRLIDFFNGKVPEDEVIGKIDALTQDFTTVESNLRTNSATQGERDQYESLRNYFGGDIPSKEQIEDCLRTDSEYKKFLRDESEKKLSENEEAEYKTLKPVFENGDISQEKINLNISLVSEVQKAKNEKAKIDSDIQTKKLELKVCEQSRPKNIKRIVLFILSALLLSLAGAVFVLNYSLIASLAFALAGIITLVLGIVSKSKVQDFSNLEAEIADLEAKSGKLAIQNDKNENEYKTFIARYSKSKDEELIALNKISVDFNRYSILFEKMRNYNSWLAGQKKQPADFENELKMFMKRFCKTEDISLVSSEIQTLNDRLARLNELEKKINADSKNSQLQKEQKEKLESILAQYKSDKSYTFAEQVQQVHDKVNDIKNAEKLIDLNKQKVLEFENNPDNDIQAFENLTKPAKSAESLRSELSEVADKISNENATIAGYQKIINDNLTFTEKKEDIETEIERLEAEKKEKNAELAILKKTQNLLAQAKENLDANYSDPMKEGFAKYLNMIGGKLNLVIDTDLKVSIDDNGRYHESESLSEGYKDMVNFCSRMALIDALFTDVKPPVILDDPFVNLDDEKVPRALQMVKDMAKEKQVIYFACHKSRVV